MSGGITGHHGNIDFSVTGGGDGSKKRGEDEDDAEEKKNGGQGMEL